MSDDSVQRMFHILCDKTNPQCLKRAQDAETPQGLFHYSPQEMETACELHVNLLEALFREEGKQLVPREVQRALGRFNLLHGGKLFVSDSTSSSRPSSLQAGTGTSPRSTTSNSNASLRVQAQGLINMLSYVNKKRRNSTTGTRASKELQRLMSASNLRSSSPPERSPKSSPESSTKAATTTKCSSASRSLLQAFGLESWPAEIGEPEVETAEVPPRRLARKTSEVQLVQVEVPERDVVSVASTEEQRDPKASPSDSKIYMDFAKGKLVRHFPDGKIEEAEMFEKSGCAFLWGRFSDGKEVESEQPCQLKILTRPAAVSSSGPLVKRPASASSCAPLPPVSEEHVRKYTCMYYKASGKAALRQCFGAKKQLFQFGSKAVSQSQLQSVGRACCAQLTEGKILEEQAKAWCEEKLS